MQKLILGLVGLPLLVAGAVMAATLITTTMDADAAPDALTQAEIEQRATAAAAAHGLQGAPTSTRAHQMTEGEAAARLNLDLARTPESATRQVWLVILQGRVVLANRVPLAPNPDGTRPRLEFDNAWFIMDTSGQVIGFGALPPGKSVDPTGPVPTAPQPQPTPVGPPKPGQLPPGTPHELALPSSVPGRP